MTSNVEPNGHTPKAGAAIRVQPYVGLAHAGEVGRVERTYLDGGTFVARLSFDDGTTFDYVMAELAGLTGRTAYADD